MTEEMLYREIDARITHDGQQLADLMDRLRQVTDQRNRQVLDVLLLTHATDLCGIVLDETAARLEAHERGAGEQRRWVYLRDREQPWNA